MKHAFFLIAAVALLSGCGHSSPPVPALSDAKRTARGCGPSSCPTQHATTLYTVGPVYITGGNAWNSEQAIYEFDAQGNGQAVELLSNLLQTPTAPSSGNSTTSANYGPYHDQIFLDPSGNVWYVGNVNGANVVVNCTMRSRARLLVKVLECVQNSSPTIGINNPQNIAVSPNGQLAVLNSDGSIAVFAPGANAQSSPTAMLAANNPALAGKAPAYLGWDPNGYLFVSEDEGGTYVNSYPPNSGRLVSFAPGASGDAAPYLTISFIAGGGIGNPACPFAIDRSSEIWVSCHIAGVYENIYGYADSPAYSEPLYQADLLELYDGPDQIAVDDFEIYLSDSEENRVVILSKDFAEPITSSNLRYLTGFAYQGGIAL